MMMVFAFLRAHLNVRAARREWVNLWDGDPRTLAVMEARLPWLERRALHREIRRNHRV